MWIDICGGVFFFQKCEDLKQESFCQEIIEVFKGKNDMICFNFVKDVFDCSVDIRFQMVTVGQRDYLEGC